jgi:uncharacterized protein YoxC
MVLTLNQVLFIILSFAAVIALVFLVLFLVQLRKTAQAGERTLIELRDLAEGLKSMQKKIDGRIDDVGEILDSSKKTVAGLAEATAFLTAKVVRPASQYWPILYPLLRLGWRVFKKRKEK